MSKNAYVGDVTAKNIGEMVVVAAVGTLPESNLQIAVAETEAEATRYSDSHFLSLSLARRTPEEYPES